jgi:TonB family protein
MRTLILVVVLASGVLAQSEPAPSVAAARELYASADYSGALVMLDRLATANPMPPDRQSIDLYRMLCLVALGRTTEADEVVAAMITRDPLYRPAESEIPPRLRPMFSDKRRVMLPGIIQSRYERAKAAFDRSDYRTAADEFTQVLLELADPDIAREASHTPLADLRVLSIGFKDLAFRALAPPPSPAAPVSTPTPVPAAPALVQESPASAVPKAPRIYEAEDTDVIAPVTLNQDIPPLHRPITAERQGVVVVVINEAGRVDSAVIAQSFDSYYDLLLLQAAKRWRYRPATRDGVAVKYRKGVQLTLSPQTN